VTNALLVKVQAQVVGLAVLTAVNMRIRKQANTVWIAKNILPDV